MAGGRNSSDQLALATRRESAVALRRQGYSYRAIAQQLDISQTQAYHDVQSVLLQTRDRTAAEADALRVLEGERLDEIYQALLPRALVGDIKAVQQLHRNIELRMRLFGLGHDAREEAIALARQEGEAIIEILKRHLPEETLSQVSRALAIALRFDESKSTIEVLPDEAI